MNQTIDLSPEEIQILLDATYQHMLHHRRLVEEIIAERIGEKTGHFDDNVRQAQQWADDSYRLYIRLRYLAHNVIGVKGNILPEEEQVRNIERDEVEREREEASRH